MIKYYEKYKEIILYLVFGFATTIVNWMSYGIFVSFLETGIFIANIFSWIFATLFAFITNKIWVFESKSFNFQIFFKEFLLFVSTRGLTGLFEILAVPFLIYIGLNYSIFGIEGMVAKVTVSIIVVILNYIFSKLVIFKSKK